MDRFQRRARCLDSVSITKQVARTLIISVLDPYRRIRDRWCGDRIGFHYGRDPSNPQLFGDELGLYRFSATYARFIFVPGAA